MGAFSYSIDPRLVSCLCRILPLEVFVETGTFKGGSLRVALRYFKECHSVEASGVCYAGSVKRFAGVSAVHLAHGRSDAWLLELRSYFAGKAVLFWLDAHWCGPSSRTSRGTGGSPLLRELAAIGSLHDHSVVLIDDARLYLCPPPSAWRGRDWPDFRSVVEALLRLGPGHRLMVINDVIVLYPALAGDGIWSCARECAVDVVSFARFAWRMRGCLSMTRRLKNVVSSIRRR